MPRKPGKPRISVIYEAILAPIPPPAQCGGLLCLNLECRQCWGVLDDLTAIFEPSPGVMVDLDDETYAALQVAARRQGTTVSAVAQVVPQKWAKGLRVPRRGASPGRS